MEVEVKAVVSLGWHFHDRESAVLPVGPERKADTMHAPLGRAAVVAWELDGFEPEKRAVMVIVETKPRGSGLVLAGQAESRTADLEQFATAADTLAGRSTAGLAERILGTETAAAEAAEEMVQYRTAAAVVAALCSIGTAVARKLARSSGGQNAAGTTCC